MWQDLSTCGRNYTGRFIMYSGFRKIYSRKTVRHVFTKPVQIEGTTQFFFPPVSCFSSLFTFLPLGDTSVCSEKMADSGGEVVLFVGISHEQVCGYCATCISCKVRKVFVPPLPCDLVDLKPRITAAVKNIDAPILTRVCGKNLNIVSTCAVSPMLHS